MKLESTRYELFTSYNSKINPLFITMFMLKCRHLLHRCTGANGGNVGFIGMIQCVSARVDKSLQTQNDSERRSIKSVLVNLN